METLKILSNTYLKPLPLPSSEIRKSWDKGTMIATEKDTELSALEIVYVERARIDGVDCAPHYFVQTLEKIEGRSRWYVFHKHGIEIHPASKERIEPVAIPSDEEKISKIKAAANMSAAALADPAIEKDMGPRIKIPGISAETFMNSAMFWVGDKPAPFTWGEFLQWNMARVPTDVAVVQRVLKLARFMLKVRSMYAQPLVITSGYRPPGENRRIGGSRFSRHIVGDAVDFYPQNDGVTTGSWKSMCRLHTGGGLAAAADFIHIDLRPGRAHWLYPGAPSFTERRY